MNVAVTWLCGEVSLGAERSTLRQSGALQPQSRNCACLMMPRGLHHARRGTRIWGEEFFKSFYKHPARLDRLDLAENSAR
jgi:hypothetical protein